MELAILDWLNLIARWAHVIVGIAWIGSSFYFVWKDNSLTPTADDPQQKRLQGEIWMVHGGGFYHAQKYKVAPSHLPDELHWFKWESYSTWLTGMALLAIVYYLAGPSVLLPVGSTLSYPVGIAVGLGLLAGGWLVYDGLCRSPIARDDRLLGLAVVALIVAITYAALWLLSDRAAFLHVGAAMATIMTANVFFTIIPNQKKIVAAMRAGETPDPKLGLTGKQRSVHNTYLTLPVVFLMLSNHYPMVYGHPYAGVLLLAICALGALVRHALVLRHTGRMPAWLLPAGGAAMAALIVGAAGVKTLAPGDAPAAAEANREASHLRPVAMAIVQQRCTACHAREPSYQGFDAPPKGIVLETPAQVRRWSASVLQQSVDSHAMPIGNVTQMQPEERALLARWLRGGEER
ncbi:hypothetical protein CKO28_04415 [Rhodovibrio sodomensis]|uniref:Urate oxidase N-terminal domain-containing protein n=1 Tax=Rhodovibrio sodomensis TaxID=1088 RepID=A0ABS1DBH4_9PROT|nr:urate hydroxylase PuuD [Rhodovibrio sodomensis]MBK1667286.1 hypothetical protein [Rhodovibrio sodomensis]